MITRGHALSLIHQAKLWKLIHSSLCDMPTLLTERALRLMVKIGKLHTDYRVAGTRMLRDVLRLDAEKVGRRHVPTLSKKMGIESICRKPNSNTKHPQYRL